MQIVYAKRRGARRMEHVGSAHDERELEALKAAAAQRLAGGQQELELEAGRRRAADGQVAGPGPLPIVASRMGHLWDGVVPGLPAARVRPGHRRGRGVPGPGAGPDHRADQQAGQPAGARRGRRRAAGVSHAQSAAGGLRQARVAAKIAAACAANAGLGPASLVLYDVTTLYFETDAGRRVSRAGLLQGTPSGAADHDRAAGRRLRVPADGRGVRGQPRRDHHHAPDDPAFMAAHQLTDVTIVADAGWCPTATSARSRPPGCRSSSAPASPTSPTSWRQWRREHPDQQIPDGLILTQPWPAGPDRPAPRPGRSTTSTRPTGPGARCAGSTSRSPRPSTRWPGRRRSSATGSSSSSAPTSP